MKSSSKTGELSLEELKEEVQKLESVITKDEEYLNELKNAGYATDDDYVTVVGNVYNQYFGNK